MNYSMLKEARELAGWSKEGEALSIYHELSKREDRRGNKGKRYTFALLLTCVLLAKMAGETTLQAIAEWIGLRSCWLQDVWPETRAAFPCAATYSTVLRTVDPAQVNQVLMDVLTRGRAEKRMPEDHIHVVLDGKTLRGTLHHQAEDQSPLHHMTLYEAKTGIVLKETMVAEKANELTHMTAFLTPVLLQGRIISADALYTQRSFCQEVLAAGADYLLVAKHNQPTLYEDLSLFFHDPPRDCLDWRTASSSTKGHGRLEPRVLWASTELTDFLARDWYGVHQVFCLRRRVEHALKCTQEIVYGITSLSPTKAAPSRLLALNREHWAIENRLHYRRDGALAEDACQVRKGSAPHILAVLNSFVLALFDFCKVSNVKQQMRCLDAHPFQAVRLLFKSREEN